MARFVTINVRGQRYCTTFQTLKHDPNSKLAKMFDESESSGKEFSMDRDGVMFGYILNFFRDFGRFVAPPTVDGLQVLLKEAEYFEIENLVILLKKRLTYALAPLNLNDVVKLKSDVIDKFYLEIFKSFLNGPPYRVPFEENSSCVVCSGKDDAEKLQRLPTDCELFKAYLQSKTFLLREFVGNTCCIVQSPGENSLNKLHLPLCFLEFVRKCFGCGENNI